MRRSHLSVLIVAALFLLGLPRVPVDRATLLREAFQRQLGPELLISLDAAGLTARPVLDIPPGPDAEILRESVGALLAERHPETTADEVAGAGRLVLTWETAGRRVVARGAVQGAAGEVAIDTTLRLLGWESLLPPLVAILLAFAFRRTLLCLLAGVWVGGTLLIGGNPLKGLGWVAYDGILRHALLDQFRIEILVFVFGLVGAVGIMTRMGGVAGLLRLVEGAVRGARSTQLFAMIMGLIIFFDDYANTILVGTTMRPLTDRWRVSRERLAYLVDSTAAPVAGISVLSTWVAYEMSLYADQLPAAGIEQDAYIIFLRTIPYRFYSLFTLMLVLLSAASGRAFGPMLGAERRARAGAVSPESGGRRRSAAERLTDKALRRTRMKQGVPPRWINAALPLLLVVSVTLGLMLHFGNVEGRAGAGLWDLDYLRGTVLSNTQSTRALALAALTGFVAALLLARGQRLLSWGEGLAAGVGNFRAMLEAVGILIMAWVMGHVCASLGTSHVLIAMAAGRLATMALALPVILFLTGAAVSFATGSSWSTMAILLPNVVGLAVSLGAQTPLGGEGLLLVSIGAVLEGSIFGDHCSPISDTTILSSVASGCPHMAHVKTQIPFALTALVVTLLAGYLPVLLGLPVGLGYLTGAGLLALAVFVWGRDAGPSTSAEPGA